MVNQINPTHPVKKKGFQDIRNPSVIDPTVYRAFTGWGQKGPGAKILSELVQANDNRNVTSESLWQKLGLMQQAEMNRQDLRQPKPDRPMDAREDPVHPSVRGMDLQQYKDLVNADYKTYTDDIAQAKSKKDPMGYSQYSAMFYPHLRDIWNEIAARNASRARGNGREDYARLSWWDRGKETDDATYQNWINRRTEVPGVHPSVIAGAQNGLLGAHERGMPRSVYDFVTMPGKYPLDLMPEITLDNIDALSSGKVWDPFKAEAAYLGTAVPGELSSGMVVLPTYRNSNYIDDDQKFMGGHSGTGYGFWHEMIHNTDNQAGLRIGQKTNGMSLADMVGSREYNGHGIVAPRDYSMSTLDLSMHNALKDDILNWGKENGLGGNHDISEITGALHESMFRPLLDEVHQLRNDRYEGMRDPESQYSREDSTYDPNKKDSEDYRAANRYLMDFRQMLALGSGKTVPIINLNWSDKEEKSDFYNSPYELNDVYTAAIEELPRGVQRFMVDNPFKTEIFPNEEVFPQYYQTLYDTLNHYNNELEAYMDRNRGVIGSGEKYASKRNYESPKSKDRPIQLTKPTKFEWERPEPLDEAKLKDTSFTRSAKRILTPLQMHICKAIQKSPFGKYIITPLDRC